MSPTLGWNMAGTSAGATGGILKCTPAVEAIAPQVVFQMASVLPSPVQQPPEVYIPRWVSVSAPQVNVYVAPQVDVQILGRVLQAHPQEPPEVYSNVLPPSVGETTGGIHPHAVRHKYLSPTGGKHPKSTAGR